MERTLHAYLTGATGKVHVARSLALGGLYVALYCSGRAVSYAVAIDEPITCKACIKRAAKEGLDISDPIRIGGQTTEEAT